MTRQGADLDRLAQLEEERRFLLRSLDDLEREYAAGDVDEVDYQELRDGYTARAAAVIREIDAGKAATLAPRRPVRWGRVAAVTAGIVAFGALAGWLVARSSGQDVPETEAVASTEDQVAVLLANARQLPPLDALNTYGQVLQLDPGNVEALTYSGWTARLVALQADGAAREELLAAATDKLDEAIAADPGYPDAQCFRAVLTFRDLEAAAAAKPFLDACLAADPPAVVADLVSALAADIDAALGTG